MNSADFNSIFESTYEFPSCPERDLNPPDEVECEESMIGGSYLCPNCKTLNLYEFSKDDQEILVKIVIEHDCCDCGSKIVFELLND